VENICERLSLISLAPLWNRAPKELLTEMVDSGIDAMIVRVCSKELKNVLGKTLRESKELLIRLHDKD
jgi:diphthine-ammonia ligase